MKEAAAVREPVAAPRERTSPFTTERSGIVTRDSDFRHGGIGGPALAGDDGLPDIVREVVASAGQGLEPAVRAPFERRFGRDLGFVRIHSDGRAAQSARAVHALAYTVGNHTVFGAAAYAPWTAAGRRTLAHELAHVMQQSRSNAAPRPSTGTPGPASGTRAEVEADGVARATDGNGALPGLSGTPVWIARQVDPLSEPLGADDMFTKLTATRAFEEAIPAHQLEATEKRLQELRDQLKKTPSRDIQREYNRLLNRYNISRLGGPGGKAGPGYSTYAIIEVIDKDGKRIAVGVGKYAGGQHAEELALASLERQLGGRTVPGGRVHAVVDQHVCSEHCQPAFQRFVAKHDLDRAHATVFRRPKLTGTGQASGKTTIRGATSASAEGTVATGETDFEYRRPGTAAGAAGGEGQPRVRVGTPEAGGAGSSGQRVRVAEGVEGTQPKVRVAEGEAPRVRIATPVEEEPHVGGGGARRRLAVAAGEGAAETPARTAIRGQVLNLGAGAALGIFQQWFKEKTIADLERLPKPKIDKRAARGYLTDPRTGPGVRILDVLGKNLKPFRGELRDHHADVQTTAQLELVGVALLQSKTTAQAERRFERLDAIAEELRAYENDLLTVRDNIEAVLELEPKALEAKKAADELRELLKNGLVLDFLFKQGLTVEEISQIDSNLAWYSVSIRIAFEEAHALKTDVDRMLSEEFTLAHQVNRIWWLEFGDQLRTHLREKRAQEQRERDRQRAEQGEPPSQLAWNSDQLGTYYMLRTDESKIMNDLRALDEEARAATQQDLPKSAARRGELLNRLRDIRKQLERYGSGPALQ